MIAPTDVAPESPQSYYRVADRLTEEIPGAFQPNQYRNPANPQTHYETTGPELWRQTAGRITHLVAGVGTGGTITGIARYLKEQNPDDRGRRRRSGGLDLLGRRGPPVPGRGRRARTSGRRPTTRASSTATSASPTATASSPRAGSPTPRGCCSAARAASRSTRRWRSAEGIDDPQALVVVILPDGGRAYLCKIFNDTWMASHGMLERTSDRSVGDVLRAKQAAGEIPPLVVVESHQKVKDVDRAAARAPRQPAPGRLPHRPGHDGRLDRRARPAAPRGRQPRDHGHADRRRDGAAVPRRRGDRPRPRGGRAAVRRPPGAARHRGRPADRASSRAPTCWRRSSHDGVRDPRGPRRPRPRPELRQRRPRDPPELDLPPAGAGRVRRGLRLQPRGQPDAAGARERARRAGGRPRAAPSPPAWPRRTR